MLILTTRICAGAKAMKKPAPEAALAKLLRSRDISFSSKGHKNSDSSAGIRLGPSKIEQPSEDIGTEREPTEPEVKKQCVNSFPCHFSFIRTQ